MIKDVDLEDIGCPFGCPINDKTILVGHDRLHKLSGNYAVVKCCSCGLIRTNPRPTADSIGFYYPDNYGPYQGSKVLDLNSTSSIKQWSRVFVKWIFDTKSQKMPAIEPSRALEIGCASGAFLHQMACQGWQVEGVEFSEKAALVAKQLGYKVHVGSLEMAPVPEHPVDLIVGWMVLEHLHDPIGCLKKLYNCACPGAWLVLSVPNASPLLLRIFNDKWYDLHLPAHLYHFTPETLAKMLESGGWIVEKVYHQRLLNNLFLSIAYVAEDKGWPRVGRWLRNLTMHPEIFYALFPFAWFLSVFGQTGRMTVWARK